MSIFFRTMALTMLLCVGIAAIKIYYYNSSINKLMCMCVKRICFDRFSVSFNLSYFFYRVYTIDLACSHHTKLLVIKYLFFFKFLCTYENACICILHWL